MPTVVTDYFKLEEGRQNIDLSGGDVWNCSLVNEEVSATAISLKGQQLWSSISGTYEASGAGYAYSALPNPGWYDGGSQIQILSADDMTWTNVTIESYGVCIWRASDGLIMGFIDYGLNTASNGNFTINWNTKGIFNKI